MSTKKFTKTLAVIIAMIMVIASLSLLTSCVGKKDIDSLQKKIDDLSAKNASLSTKVSDLESKQSAQATQISEIKAALDSLTTKVGTLETKVGALETSLNTLSGKLTDLTNTVGTKVSAEQLNALSGEVTTVKNALADYITANDGAIAGLNGAIQGQFGALWERVTEVNAAVEEYLLLINTYIEDADALYAHMDEFRDLERDFNTMFDDIHLEIPKLILKVEAIEAYVAAHP